MNGTAITKFVGGACSKNTTAKDRIAIASMTRITRMNGPRATSLSILLRNRDVTGTIRIDFKPAGRAIFRLIAIDTPWQGQGLGSIMLEMAEDYARTHGAGSICLNSVADAYGFYAVHGFMRARWDGCTGNPTEIPVMKLLPGIATMRCGGACAIRRHPSIELGLQSAAISSLSSLVGASRPVGRPDKARYSARRMTADRDTPSSRAMALTVLVRSGHSSTKRCIRSVGHFRSPWCMTASEKLIRDMPILCR